MSVNDRRGPSIDSVGAATKGKKAAKGEERLAHRSCNTGKGATKPVVPWPADLFVVDPAPIIAVAERLGRKGGREVVARCPDRRMTRSRRARGWWTGSPGWLPTSR